MGLTRFNLATDADKILPAWRTITRMDRAVQLVDFVVEESQGLFLVRSESKPDREYTVDLVGKSCDCPDWTFRGSVNGIPCKHIMAAYLSAHRKPGVDAQ